MTIVGIVAEFNPLHNGHKYIIDYARNELKADYVVIAMSGDYVQRGEPAIFDKHIRAKSALISGADACFMLPVCISTSSANYFALGSVALLNSLGCDYLLFGSENGNISEIRNNDYVKGQLDSPNNILAREYVKAIDSLGLNIEPITIKRQGSDYNDTDSVIDNKCSASFIRKHYARIFNEITIHEQLIPENVYSEYTHYINNNEPVFVDSFSAQLLSQLINNLSTGYSQYFDVYEDLSSKIAKNINSFNSFSQFTDSLKSKDITRSHISRALLHICLNITKSDVDMVKHLNYAPYGRLLGFKKNSDILAILSERSSIDIISKLSDYIASLKGSTLADSKYKLALIEKDMNTSHLYSYLSNKGHIINECQRKIVVNS